MLRRGCTAAVCKSLQVIMLKLVGIVQSFNVQVSNTSMATLLQSLFGAFINLPMINNR